MKAAKSETQKPPASSAGWLRGPVVDIALLGFAWVPFYTWVVGSLGLGRPGVGLSALPAADEKQALALATMAALACTYVHRHYTFFVVYGDPDTFASSARRFIVAPIVLFGAVALARLSSTDMRAGALSPWGLLLIVVGGWNVWHTLQQRYGILRIYGGKARGGLETEQAGKRDRGVLWAMVAITAGVLVGARRDLIGGHTNANRLRDTLEPLAASLPGRALTAALVLGGLAVVARWLSAELRAPISPGSRAARLWFVGSTAALFSVFIAHGPVVGYLCFGVAHSLEYVTFVHHFGHAKHGARPRGSVAASLLGHPVASAPLLVGLLLGAYFALQDARGSDAYLIYYNGTTLLHFLYDGWIWKVRKPSVAKPLGVAAA